ncbi:PHB depolymerase family esterase [Thalassomonas viridans]|uniref:PHB depolymerase family esterase n=1 Tax=Thalassomonas viridans TaxID=137584 RepID=A0AAE9YYY1_9GAMM|nr:PHB depolymerase family esterase [Thalassomonas viridans]WDE03741.1 PHB depolymerase family esterase [Thalassomonas viridans]
MKTTPFRQVLSCIFVCILYAAIGTGWINTASASSPPDMSHQGGITKLENFGENPGELNAYIQLPEQPQGAKLVVLLHGCVQEAKIFASDSGMGKMALAKNAILLLPEQQKTNNVANCFNWFSENDISKHSGEMLSLFNMISHSQKRYQASEVFIAGLSAGGAMTAALLANYPDLFTAGAIIGGLPYQCASNLIKAIACMKSGPGKSTQEFIDIVLRQHPNRSKWPRLTVWSGIKDTVVNPKNATVLAQQWAALNGITKADNTIKHDEYLITEWRNSNNEVQVKQVEMLNLKHGLPVGTQQTSGKAPAEYMLPAPLSAVTEIAKFWQL